MSTLKTILEPAMVAGSKLTRAAVAMLAGALIFVPLMLLFPVTILLTGGSLNAPPSQHSGLMMIWFLGACIPTYLVSNAIWRGDLL